VTNGNIPSKTEVLRLKDLVRRGVVENSFGMNTGLVREGTVAAATGILLSIDTLSSENR
jgi:hypothetical protein